MAMNLVCWKCGADLGGLPQPLSRRAECPACHGELHVCRMCRHHDVGKAKQCREPMAEEVQGKTRANFCDWFQPAANAFSPAPVAAANARDALDALFGDTPANNPKGDAKSDIDRLFGD